jgi:hypothetical protein
MTIQNSAILCSVKLTKLGNSRKDKDATRALAAEKGASARAVKVSKELLPDNQLLRDITQLDDEIRAKLRTYALPWDAANWLLPTAHFAKFSAAIDGLARARESLVMDFVRDYPAAVLRAEKQLGAMYDPYNYTHPDDVADAFTADIVYAPIPTAGDFRIDMESSAVAELADNYEQALEAKQRALTMDTWDRIREVAEALEDRLTDDPNAKVTKTGAKTFRDTLVTNAEEIIELLEGFNITNDPDVARVRQELAIALNGVTPDALRNNAALRSQVASAAASVLNRAELVADKFGF